MDGLQPWAKTKLKRRGVQNLADAIAKAESLVDYSNHKESTSKPKDQKEGQAKVWRDRSPRKETHRDNTPLRHKELSPWKGKARQCPQRQALSSLLARYQEDNDVEGCQEGAHIGSLQLLNGIQSTPKIETKGLLGTKQESKVLSALQLEEEDANRGSLETTMLALTACYKGKSQVQHRGAERRRHQTDKKQRPPRFKEGSTHRGGKSKIRRSIPTISQRPRDEGIAGLGGGGCHDPPPCPKVKPRTIEKGPGQSRTEGCTAKDLGSQDGSKVRGALPGTMGSSRFQKLPARSRRDQDPGGSRQTQGAPEGPRGF
ncbi:hypothetical protein V6N13_075005 [Hibiscus sabdariffa]